MIPVYSGKRKQDIIEQFPQQKLLVWILISIVSHLAIKRRLKYLLFQKLKSRTEKKESRRRERVKLNISTGPLGDFVGGPGRRCCLRCRCHSCCSCSRSLSLSLCARPQRSTQGGRGEKKEQWQCEKFALLPLNINDLRRRLIVLPEKWRERDFLRQSDLCEVVEAPRGGRAWPEARGLSHGRRSAHDKEKTLVTKVK